MSIKIIRREQPSISPALSALSPVLQRIFAARGIQSTHELSDELSALLVPDTLAGLDKALPRLMRALSNQERILVVGDFDADGATSTAVCVRLLRDMGAESVDFLVPNRLTCGYGLTPKLVEIAKTYSPDLIITVDNGIASIEGVEAANQNGIDVLVTDHHLPGDSLPKAVAIVNPNQQGCAFPSRCLAGVGVVFYLMIAFRKYLLSLGWFEKKGIEIPNLASVLDIVALGTVADVVPLDHNNRILVSQGIKRMRSGIACPGIRALLMVAGKDPADLCSQDLGFALGPRLNAAGRLEDMSIGIACLLSRSWDEALSHARTLDELNKTRKEIESTMSAQAFDAVDRLELSGVMPLGVCVYQPDWHQGVVGLVASRVKERLSRPVIAFARDGSHFLKGSARSIPGFHIRDALVRVSVRQPELIEQFGGHAMAAGLKIKTSHFEAFQEAFAQSAADELTEADCVSKIETDGSLEGDQLSLAFAEDIRYAIPWGQAFPEPVFDGYFDVLEDRVVGQDHLKMKLTLRSDSQPIDAIWFRADLERWAKMRTQCIQAAYRVDINAYRNRRQLQLIILTVNEVSHAS